MTDQLGQIVASYTYDAWGVILLQSGPTAEENSLRYASYRYDNDTNFYYLIEKYYNLKEGVFLSRDSQAGNLEDPKSQNGYNYANQNPYFLDLMMSFLLGIRFLNQNIMYGCGKNEKAGNPVSIL